MLVKIHKGGGGLGPSLEYSISKVERGVGRLVSFSEGIGSMTEFRNRIAELERGNIRTENTSFHLSFNPSPSENLPEQDALAYIDEYMQEMGYGGQPYVVFEHTDTGRLHYHVVSCRVGADGHKIDAWQDYGRSMDICDALNDKFGLTTAGEDDSSETDDWTVEEEPQDMDSLSDERYGDYPIPDDIDNRAKIPPYRDSYSSEPSPESSPELDISDTSDIDVRSDIDDRPDIVKDPSPLNDSTSENKANGSSVSDDLKKALSVSTEYYFTDFRQFQEIMRLEGAKVTRTDGEYFLLQELSPDGKPINSPISSKELDGPRTKDIEDMAKENKRQLASHYEDMDHIRKMVDNSMGRSDSLDEFSSTMKRLGIDVVMCEDSVHKSDVLYIDSVARSCFSGSDIGPMYSYTAIKSLDCHDESKEEKDSLLKEADLIAAALFDMGGDEDENNLRKRKRRI